jgi:hypothetical protein
VWVWMGRLVDVGVAQVLSSGRSHLRARVAVISELRSRPRFERHERLRLRRDLWLTLNRYIKYRGFIKRGAKTVVNRGFSNDTTVLIQKTAVFSRRIVRG